MSFKINQNTPYSTYNPYSILNPSKQSDTTAVLAYLVPINAKYQFAQFFLANYLLLIKTKKKALLYEFLTEFI